MHMQRIVRSSIFCLGLITISPIATWGDVGRQDQIEQFVTNMSRLGSAQYPTFSPDGKNIAYISDLNGSAQIWILPVDGGYPQLVTAGDTAIQTVEWSPVDTNLLAYGTGQGSLDSQLYIVHPDGTGLRRITPGNQTRNVGPAWTADGKNLIATSNARGRSRDEPCLIDIASSKIEWLLNSDKSLSLVSVSKDGKFGLASNWTSFVDGVPYVIGINKKTATKLMPDRRASEWYGAFAPDSRTIYLYTGGNNERSAFGRVKLDENGKPGKLEILAQRPDADVGFILSYNPPTNPAATQAAVVWLLDDTSKLSLIDLSSGKEETICLPSGITRASNVRYSPDGKSLVMSLSSPFATRDIWLMSLATKEFKRLTFSPHAGIDFAKLVKPEKISFKSFDGLELEGYLYRPVGQNHQVLSNSKLPPYVIDFHGGLPGKSGPSSHFQPLLEQGIGVFAPNVRGSSGRGQAFADLDNGALRGNAIKDIKACVDYLVTNKIADAKRIGIQGHSGGGYMAMAGLTEYPDLFAAGLEADGPIDLIAEVKKIKAVGYDLAEYGGPTMDETMLKSISPYYKADRIKAPFMIQQGEKDIATDSAREIAKQLKASGHAPFEYIEFAGEEHILYKMQNRIKSEIARVEFFVKYLKPD